MRKAGHFTLRFFQGGEGRLEYRDGKIVGNWPEGRFGSAEEAEGWALGPDGEEAYKNYAPQMEAEEARSAWFAELRMTILQAEAVRASGGKW